MFAKRTKVDIYPKNNSFATSFRYFKSVFLSRLWLLNNDVCSELAPKIDFSNTVRASCHASRAEVNVNHQKLALCCYILY